MEKKKRIVVLGAGESGVGAAVLAQVKGFDVFVSDMSVIQDKYKEQLDRYEIPFEEGKHTPDLILNADEVVKSPGIPDRAPMIAALTGVIRWLTSKCCGGCGEVCVWLAVSCGIFVLMWR